MALRSFLCSNRCYIIIFTGEKGLSVLLQNCVGISPFSASPRKNNSRRKGVNMKVNSILVKWVGVVLAIIMVVCALPAFSFETKAETSGDYEYEFLEDGTIEITEYLGDNTDVVIPSKIDGYDVTQIGYGVFHLSNIESVSLPDSVISIGDSTFGYCENLKTISLPASITSIGRQAFINCTSLTNITLPNNLKSIGSMIFTGCSSLKTIEIPKSLKTISQEAFEGCESLEAITLPDTITRIEGFAFQNCYSLKSISLPKGISTIEYALFSECKNLKSISIPDGVNCIESSAFSGCESLTDIVLPKGITIIDQNVFENCKSLENINIPTSVLEINWDAFSGCSSLTSISIPGNVTDIGDRAFFNCSSLKSIDIPKSVSYIGWDAFSGCTGLKEANYAGSNIEWDSIQILDGNECLTKTVHCNSYVPSVFTEGDIHFNYEESYGNNDSSTTKVYYTDNFFKVTNSIYNNVLAKCSLGMAMSSGHKDFAEDFLKKCGFSAKSIEFSSRWNLPLSDDQDKAAYTFATKEIEGQTVIAIAIRSYNYGNEWGSNGRVGYKQKVYGYHYGFNKAADDVISSLKKYCSNNHIDLSNAKIWVAGFSRGAAVANCVGTRLEEKGSISRDNLYCYTFATPRTVTEENVYDSAQGIYNIINPLDLVPRVPLNSSTAVSVLTYIKPFNHEKPWNYTWNGTTLELPCMNYTSDYEARLKKMKKEFTTLTEKEREYKNYNVQLLQALLDVLCVSTDSERYYVNKLQDQLIVPLLEKHMGKGMVDDTVVLSIISQIPDARKMLIAKGLFTPNEFRGLQDSNDVADFVLMQQHWPETYLAWMNTDYMPQKPNPTKAIFIQCPVNVEVYNTDDVLVARINNDIVDDSIEGGLDAYVDASGTKMIAMPTDGDFRVVITATDEGTMDYSVKEFNEDGELLRKVIYDDIEIQKDQVFTGEVLGEMDTPSENYNLTTNDTEIAADFDLAEGELNSIEVSGEVTGSGIATGEGLYTNGDSVVLDAFEKLDSAFEGWYLDDQLISSEKTITFTADSSKAYVARFSDPCVNGHSWKHVTIKAGLLKNGSEYDECTDCGEKKAVKVLKGYAKYYVKSLKVVRGKKSFTVKWKKQSAANQKKFNGYQIRYSTKKSMKGAKTVKASKSSASKIIKKLKKNKKYYVQVRTFTKKAGITYYSKWSALKSIKTK